MCLDVVIGKGCHMHCKETLGRFDISQQGLRTYASRCPPQPDLQYRKVPCATRLVIADVPPTDSALSQGPDNQRLVARLLDQCYRSEFAYVEYRPRIT